MMPCREFVETITTEPVGALSWSRRLALGSHRLICHRCRAFEANNRALDNLLQVHRQRLEEPAPPADEPLKTRVNRP
ncbi:hypothetical protein [Inhella gelatinilytica]|uniref:Zinc-finger domain-containing protein n=1 Tax=Inhella gelatinilytica TaxID=2795030 RepID=A0A931NF03_9BURK|nr:hypothetical protein [Inhella gelatinilytica]MBH9553041.1 hypothetical protein [Inhella gelatinilytica]